MTPTVSNVLLPYSCPIYKRAALEANSAKGEITLLCAVFQGWLEWQDITDRLYEYTTCKNCQTTRLSGLDINVVVEAARAELVERGIDDSVARQIVQNIRRTHNPFGEGLELRGRVKGSGGLNLLLCFVGRMATYGLPSIAEATIKIHKHGGVDLALLKEEEWCCGSVALRTGHIKGAEELAKHNVDANKATGANRVVKACAGCFGTLSVEYPRTLGIGTPFEVVRFPVLLKDLIDEGRPTFPDSEKIHVTYHDPCHIGCHMGTYDEPRKAMDCIPGVSRCPPRGKTPFFFMTAQCPHDMPREP